MRPRQLLSDVRRRLVAVLGVAAVGTVMWTACGVPTSSDFEPIDPEDVPPALSDTTTTTTSTLPETTTAPTGWVTGTSIEPTTTVVDTEQVELYFVTSSTLDPRLTSVTRPLVRRASLNAVIAALEEGVQPDIGTGLRTLVLEGLVTRVTELDGVAVVELDGEVFSEVLDSDQDALIAQLVLTLGIRPGVGQVRFMKDDEPFAVRDPSNNRILTSQPVAADAFRSLLSDSSDPSPTDSVPTTTVPLTSTPETRLTTTTVSRPQRSTTTTPRRGRTSRGTTTTTQP